MIAEKFTTTFSIRRKQWVDMEIGEKTVKQTMETEVGTFKGYIQQASGEYVQFLNLSITKGYIVWCPLGTSVSEGDVIYKGDLAYTVRNKQVNNDGCNGHIQLGVELIGKEDGS